MKSYRDIFQKGGFFKKLNTGSCVEKCVWCFFTFMLCTKFDKMTKKRSLLNVFCHQKSGLFSCFKKLLRIDITHKHPIHFPVLRNPPPLHLVCARIRHPPALALCLSPHRPSFYIFSPSSRFVDIQFVNIHSKQT